MFENEYIMDKKLTKEYVLSVIGKRTMIMGTLLFIFGFIMYLFVNDGMKYTMLTCSCIGLFCAIATPIVMINNLQKSAKRLHNGKLEKTKVVFDNNIVMDEGKVHLEFEYNQIKQIAETKNFIVLRFDDNAGILVLKGGFTKGNEEDFVKFIKEKTNIV